MTHPFLPQDTMSVESAHICRMLQVWMVQESSPSKDVWPESVDMVNIQPQDV